jgi:hypothetical protein
MALRSSPRQRIGIAEPALDRVEICEIAQCYRDIGMLGAKQFLSDREHFLSQGYSLTVPSFAIKRDNLVVQCLCII